MNPENNEPRNNEVEKNESTPRPPILDVIEIDGRWAQVVGGGNMVKFLSDEIIVEINWDEYNYNPLKFLIVGDLVEANKISQNDYAVIHWGSEQEKNPKIINQVHVFGKYTKK